MVGGRPSQRYGGHHVRGGPASPLDCKIRSRHHNRQRPSVTSATWASFCKRIGVAHTTTTAYHPQSNGMVERSHRQLKDALRARLADSDWPSHLPWVLLGLRAAPKEDTGASSAELVLGAPLVLPGELLSSAEPPATEFLQRLRQAPPPPLRGHSPMPKLQPRFHLPCSRQSSFMSDAAG
jgi:transposase InsO family protein